MKCGLPLAGLAIVTTLGITGMLQIPSNPAHAQTGAACNGNKILRACQATAQVTGRWLTLRSNDLQCSRVDWFRNGQPQTSVFRGGIERVELLGQSPGEISIGQCTVVETLDGAEYDSPSAKPRRHKHVGRCVAGKEVDQKGNIIRPEQDLGKVTVEASSFAEAYAMIQQICMQKIRGSGG